MICQRGELKLEAVRISQVISQVICVLFFFDLLYANSLANDQNCRFRTNSQDQSTGSSLLKQLGANWHADVVFMLGHKGDVASYGSDTVK